MATSVTRLAYPTTEGPIIHRRGSNHADRAATTPTRTVRGSSAYSTLQSGPALNPARARSSASAAHPSSPTNPPARATPVPLSASTLFLMITGDAGCPVGVPAEPHDSPLGGLRYVAASTGRNKAERAALAVARSSAIDKCPFGETPAVTEARWGLPRVGRRARAARRTRHRHRGRPHTPVRPSPVSHCPSVNSPNRRTRSRPVSCSGTWSWPTRTTFLATPGRSFRTGSPSTAPVISARSHSSGTARTTSAGSCPPGSTPWRDSHRSLPTFSRPVSPVCTGVWPRVSTRVARTEFLSDPDVLRESEFEAAVAGVEPAGSDDLAAGEEVHALGAVSVGVAEEGVLSRRRSSRPSVPESAH